MTAAAESRRRSTSPLRILVVAACPMPAGRGTPVRIERLSEALAARGHAVTIATYHLGEMRDMGEMRDAEPGPVIRRIGRRFEQGSLPPGPTLAKLFCYDPALVALTRRLVVEQRFDIVHAHHVEGLIVGALAKRRHIPLVYDAHTMLGSELPSYMAPWLQPMVRSLAHRLDAWLPRLADHTVCAGAGTRDALIDRHGLPADRVTFAVNGVEIEHFAAAARARILGLPSARAPRILYTGTLAAYQDVHLLLRAFARLRKRHGTARLVIATTSAKGAVADAVRSLGIGQAIDFEPDSFARLPEQLARATLAVVPRTRCDGVPQKLLNYMAGACPIVASAGSSMLLDHEVTALVVANGDVAGLAAAMARLIEQPSFAACLGARAHDYVARRMSWDATAALVEGIYGRLLVPRGIVAPATSS